MDQLATCVSSDPAICARVLDAFGATEPGRGRLPPLSRITEAVGRRTLSSVAIGARACSAAEDEEVSRCRRQAVHCALIARALAESIDYPSPDEAYLAGLLHNMDELLLLARPGDGQERLGESVQDDIERSGALGAAMIAGWGLNPVLADAVRYCNEPEDYVLDAHPLVRLVHVAAACVRDSQRVLAGDVGNRLPGVTAETLSELLDQAASELEDRIPSAADPDQRRRLEQLLREVALLSELERGGRQAGLLERTLRLMTGVRRLCRFDLDEAARRLCWVGEDDDSPLTGISVRLAGGHSLLARALSEGAIVHSFDPDTPALDVADRQIAGALGTEGLLCLPLVDGQDPSGVLVLGIGKGQLRGLLARRHLLQRLAGAVVAAEGAEQDTTGNAAAEQERLRRIVHEINNPLSIVRNYLKVLGLRLESEHPASSVLQVIEDELLRASSLVAKIVEPEADKAPSELEAVQINAVIADLMRLAPSRDGVRVVLALDENLPPIVTGRDALKQVLTNLVNNALEAMDGGGRLTVRTRDWVKVDGTPGIEIEISDTGPGIAPHLRKTLFEPVATTKGEGHSGLGLSIVKKLIESLDGSIRVHSTSEQGTTFQIMLPRRLDRGAGANKTTEAALGPEGN